MAVRFDLTSQNPGMPTVPGADEEVLVEVGGEVVSTVEEGGAVSTVGEGEAVSTAGEGEVAVAVVVVIAVAAEVEVEAECGPAPSRLLKVEKSRSSIVPRPRSHICNFCGTIYFDNNYYDYI